MKQQPFTIAVRHALRSSSKCTQKPSPSNLNFDADSDEQEHAIAASSSSSPPHSRSRKKARVTDAKEERLQRFEELHIEKKRNKCYDSSSNSDTDSSSSSEEVDEGVSTSEDAVYGEKEEPKFDLMKSMLRQGYNQSSNTKPKLEEKNMEMEVAINKTKDKIDMTSGAATAKKDAKASFTAAADAHGMEVNGKEGPRFRDLGGMKEVLEELKMEVIVPLYHPHLPRWLGVRPMAGILLHGPPGCGKTKLAHAIANETGVPFYKISATEVVSGVSGIHILFSFFDSSD